MSADGMLKEHLVINSAAQQEHTLEWLLGTHDVVHGQPTLPFPPGVDNCDDCDILEKWGEQKPSPREYITDPNDRLVSNASTVSEWVSLAATRVECLAANNAHDGGALLKQLGEDLQALTGNRDAAFFSTLPPPGTPVVILQALCGLRELTLLDGDCTLTGRFVDALERALQLTVIRCNISMYGSQEPLQLSQEPQLSSPH